MDQVTVPRATLQQVLEALEYENSWHAHHKVKPYVSTIDAITALRAALEQQKPPPEAQTEAEKIAYCAGWWAAMEQKREQPERATITVQEAWEAAGGNPGIKATKEELITALQLLDKVCDEAPLEQTEQEPVAWLYRHKTEPWKQATVVQRMDHLRGSDEWHEAPLYTHPPRREPEQATPVAWIDIEEDGTCHGLRYWSEPGRREHALYPHPPRRDAGQKPVAWMYVDAHEPLNRHLEWTQDRKGYRGDWIKTPLYEAKQQPQKDVPETDCGNMEPAAWIDNTGHPKHRLYRQSATEKRLYGPLRPLYAAPPTTTTQPEPK
jgi:hypothetical protein